MTIPAPEPAPDQVATSLVRRIRERNGGRPDRLDHDLIDWIEREPDRRAASPSPAGTSEVGALVEQSPLNYQRILDAARQCKAETGNEKVLSGALVMWLLDKVTTLAARVEAAEREAHVARGQIARVESLDKALDDWMARGIKANFRIAKLEARATAAEAALAGAVADLQDCCAPEVTAFEEWARGQNYDMTEHPLHWLFLDAKTHAARHGWKAALAYARALKPGTSEAP